MVYLITGTTHTGKTNVSQKMLEKYKVPYLSIDHLKMGLIRSGNTNLTVYDDEKLTIYLWDIVKEIVKTVIENNQNLIIEGCYIPFDWRKDFEEEYLKDIKYCCLVMSDKYIDNHFDKIKRFCSVIEKRGCNDDLKIDELKKDNQFNLMMCEKYNLKYLYIDEEYNVDVKSLFL